VAPCDVGEHGERSVGQPMAFVLFAAPVVAGVVALVVLLYVLVRCWL
jgi:hypothetical protein